MLQRSLFHVYMSMIEVIHEYEKLLENLLGWPLWSLHIIVVLCICIVIVNGLQSLYSNNKMESTTIKPTKVSMEFRWFQFSYLSVYLIVMLADWLQGTNMYTLYSSYGLDVGTLFLTGFVSSAVIGTFLGTFVDTWGRRTGCIVFCLLEIVINILEHIPNMTLLIIGRILGGLSTSLLFTAFESWMVSEHRKKGFDESLLASTFSISSWGNGLSAIIAGFLAQSAADLRGDIGPFQLAIILTILSLFLILALWGENFGHSDNNHDTSDKVASIWNSLASSCKLIITSPLIFCLGLSQALFEGAVYTFVFVWVPSFLAVDIPGNGSLPTGLVFSAFMLSMTMGGMLFGLIMPIFPGKAEGLSIFVYLVSGLVMFIPVFFFNFWSLMISFLILEAMVGMFNSCGGILRSQYYPEEHQSSLMSVFRLPLNIVVMVGTMLASSNSKNDIKNLQFVFGVVGSLHLCATGLQIMLVVSTKNKAELDKKTN